MRSVYSTRNITPYFLTKTRMRGLVTLQEIIQLIFNRVAVINWSARQLFVKMFGLLWNSKSLSA